MRLAHKILHVPDQHMMPWNKGEMLRCGDQAKFFKIKILQSHIVICDNVAEMHAESEQMVWDVREDYPCVAPPFDVTFLEWQIPKAVNTPDGIITSDFSGQMGCLIISPEDKNIAVRSFGNFESPPDDRRVLLSNVEQSHRVCWCEFFICMNKGPLNGRAIYLGVRTYWFINKVGECESTVTIAFNDAARSVNWEGMCQVPMLSLSFMHCKNVKTSDATSSAGPDDKWLRRHRQPRLVYKTLEINPMREVLRREGNLEQSGLKKALHICRGHFANYTEDKPLFGHTVGMVWKPQHVRGSKEHGQVVKDYKLSPK